MANEKRAQRRVIALEIEGTPGQDANPTVPADVLDVSAFDPDSGIETIEIDEFDGSLDQAPPVRGPVRPTAALRGALKGEANIATLPNIDKLLRIAGFLRVSDANPTPSAGTTSATGGTATTFTVDTAVDTDWPNTDDALTGRPVLLSVNPATPTRCVIVSYKMSGAIATVTVSKTFSPALDATTDAVVPAHDFWGLHSGVIETASVYDYNDGVLTKYLGSMADLTLSASGGRPFEFNGNLRSIYPSTPRSDVAHPTYTPSRTLRAPLWKNGELSYGSRAGAGTSFSLRLGNVLENPIDPNEAEGIGPTCLGSRQVGGDLALYLTLVANRDLLQDALDQVVRPISALTDEAQGAGNRFALLVPGAQVTTHRTAAEGIFASESVSFRSTGGDALAFSICRF